MWRVVASRVRVFLGILGPPSVGVSCGKKYFFLVKMERSSFTVAEELLNNAYVYLQVIDFSFFFPPRFFKACNQL